MGALLARFKKKKSTVEILENVVKDIDQLENERQNSVQQQKRIVGYLVFYSVLVYIILATVFYFYYFPNNWRDRFLYSLPLLIFPILIWLIRKLLLWYFVRRLKYNEEALANLKEKKKKILDEVMEKETYRKAKEILDKYDPNRSKPIEETPSKPANVGQTQLEGQALRHRTLPHMTPGIQRNIPPTGPNGQPLPFTPARPIPVTAQNSAMQDTPYYQRPVNLVRPVLPRDRTVLDRLVEALVGDGPQNRYALICQRCSMHNGMALREEFEYLAFRCCYCAAFNPARKDRPLAPRLVPEDLPQAATVVSPETQVDSLDIQEQEEAAGRNVPIKSEEEEEEIDPTAAEALSIPSDVTEATDLPRLSDIASSVPETISSLSSDEVEDVDDSISGNNSHK